MFRLLLILSLLCAPAFAAEVITDFSEEKSLPVLNEELRGLNTALQKQAEDIADLESSATAAATQAQMETASSTSVYVSPGRAQHHPGMPKATCRFDGTATGTNACTSSYNVTSVTRNDVGDYTLTFTTAFSSANSVIPICMAEGSGSSENGTIATSDFDNPPTTTAVRILTVQDANSPRDIARVFCSVWGDQ